MGRTLHAGFCDNERKLCLFTDHQIFDRFHKYNLKSEQVRKGKVALTLKELQQFEVGDYVVHIDHGVGIFGGLVRLNQGGAMQEVIRINYRDQGAIYVSIHALYKISKYKGREGEPPRISRLGTGAWERLKERTKTKIKDIARDLIKLYSRRREEKGFAFSPTAICSTSSRPASSTRTRPTSSRPRPTSRPTWSAPAPWTASSAATWASARRRSPCVPPSRLPPTASRWPCWCPPPCWPISITTPSPKRLKDLPVRVEYLSAARNAKQTKEMLEDLEEGKIDIIIGTHKLIGKTVHFKDLGLLIIDEEQKFGVSTKEKLRQMKTNVDTLTLTATPIPRTLQFSLMGARDLSVIQTPPPNRYPIQTEVCTFSPEVIAEAIGFEMSRNGQVFIVNNRISQLPELAEIIIKHVPDARVAVAHGQMPPEQLENVMLAFADYDYDVLISTTIIESGLDIPNANTIIINGRPQLRPLRPAPDARPRGAFQQEGLLLPACAAPFCSQYRCPRRLQAIENFSDLGSGIHIAMQDLDIRGAGNLLGAEQSGFIADLGYETYQKILSEAVKELRHDEFHDLFEQRSGRREVTQWRRLRGRVPAGQQPAHVLQRRLCAHQHRAYAPLPRAGRPGERRGRVEAFRRRLIDRFGPIPEEARNSSAWSACAGWASRFAWSDCAEEPPHAPRTSSPQTDSPFYASPVLDRIIEFCALNPVRCQLREADGVRSMVIQEVISVEAAIKMLESVKGEPVA